MESLDLSGFGGVYAGKRVLVTGHTGFKGSWLVLWLRALGAEVAGIALDPDTHPAHWSLLALKDVADQRVDLRDAHAVQRAVRSLRPEYVFHLAAQPLVRRSYREPVQTFASNVTGLVNLLEAVRACASVRVLVNATTDKVYAEKTNLTAYGEDDPLGGHDPYSTSKACAELITDCYQKSFFKEAGIRVATGRAGNVIGGGDWAEDRLVPDLVRAAASGHALEIRNPHAIRPWQHVLEPLSGYLRLGQALTEKPELAGAWNFGPGTEGEISVQSVVDRLGTHWNALRITHNDAEQPREAEVLRLDASKSARVLGWQPTWDIETTLARTARWYHRFEHTGSIESINDLNAYVSDARQRGLEWAA